MIRTTGVALAALLLISCRQQPEATVADNVIEWPSPDNAAASANVQVAAAPFPALTGRVVDNAELLTPEQEAVLSARAETLERRTGSQFAIATVMSLGGQPIADYTTALGNHWRLGQAGRNNGVLMVIAPTERKVWISVGDGVLHDLPNGRTQQIVDQMIPSFRETRYFEGIDRGSRAIVAQLAGTGGQAARR